MVYDSSLSFLLCYHMHPYLVSLIFADLLSLHLVTFIFFYLLLLQLTKTTLGVCVCVMIWDDCIMYTLRSLHIISYNILSWFVQLKYCSRLSLVTSCIGFHQSLEKVCMHIYESNSMYIICLCSALSIVISQANNCIRYVCCFALCILETTL